MYYHTFSKLADHRLIEEKGYVKLIIIFLFTRATPGTLSSKLYVCIVFSCSVIELSQQCRITVIGLPRHLSQSCHSMSELMSKHLDLQ